MENIELFIVLYAVIILLTVFFVVKKKTSWTDILFVVIFPIYFLFVLWDVFGSSKKEEKQEPEEAENEELN